jgi:hypothetical protein
VVTARDGQPVGRLDASSHGAVTSNQAFFLEWRDMIAAAAARTAQPMSAAATRPVSALMDALLAAEGTHA